MDTLMMISDSERDILNGDIFSESVEIRTDREVFNELLLSEYVNVVFSSNFADIYGHDNVIMAINLFKNLTSTHIHYLSLNGTGHIDDIYKHMLSLGIRNIHYIKWETFTLEDFRLMLSSNDIVNPIKIQEEGVDESKLLLLKTGLETMLESESVSYLKENKGLLLDTVKGYLMAMKENLDLKKKISSLKEENHILTLDSKETRIQMDILDDKYKKTKEDFLNLRTDILKYKSSIEDYNNRILNSKIAERPRVRLDNPNMFVLYFKEFEDVGFFNFYESIFYNFSNVNKIYTKSIVLAEEGRQFFDPYSSKGYLNIQDGINSEIVIMNDKMVRFGNPTTLLKNVSKSNYKVELLMIYDRTDSEDLAVDTDNIFPFYVGSYRDKIKTLEIPESSWISPFEGNWENIQTLMERRILDQDSLVVFNALVSNHPFTKYLISILLGGD